MNLKMNYINSIHTIKIFNLMKHKKSLLSFNSAKFSKLSQFNKQSTTPQSNQQNKKIFQNFDSANSDRVKESENSKNSKSSSKSNSSFNSKKIDQNGRRNSPSKIITRREENIKVNLADDKNEYLKQLNLPEEKKYTKETYACMYYRHKLESEFDLFNLRNLLYSYIFAKQRTGKLHLNICDSYYSASNEEKNQKVQELLKLFDWIDIKLDFEEKLQKKIFESQRKEDYEKWLKFLIGQRDAYICFCKNYMKCDKNCFDSAENLSLKKDFYSNPEVMYVRFRNQNSEYKLFDYMEREDVVFDSSQYEDFLLYKNFNKQYTECFKRVVDDDVFNVTHIMEDKKSFNPYKNAILTKHLIFSEKKYIELPNIKVKYWNKETFEKLELKYLKSRFILPESILNEAYMLGHSKGPLKEYKELLVNNKDKDLVDFSKILLDFDLSYVTQMGSTFDMRRLLYFNKRLLIKKFIRSHESVKPKVFEEFKENFFKVFPKHVNKIKDWDHEKWRKMIYLITPEIMTFEDLYTFYFLFEKPIVSAINKENKKVIKTYFLDNDYKKYILKEIITLFNKIKTFDSYSVNREISYFIFKKYQQDKHLCNVNFFQLVKFILTGYADCPNIGEVCELIGKREVLTRVKKAFSLDKATMVENVKLLEEKRNNSMKMLLGLKVDEKLLETEIKEDDEDSSPYIENDKDKFIESNKL